MTDMVLRGLPDELHDAIRRRAEARGTTPEAEAEAILHEAMFHERLKKVLAEKGLGSALVEIGREFNITDEFEGLRDPAPSRPVDFG